jgi:hypothetical protein
MTHQINKIIVYSQKFPSLVAGMKREICGIDSSGEDSQHSEERIVEAAGSYYEKNSELSEFSDTESDGNDQTPGLLEWERFYIELDRSATTNNFKKAEKLCELLCDEKRWDRRILIRPWSKMPDDKIRPWRGQRPVYPSAYRVIDGIREAWICLLMDYCKWDRAVRIVDTYIYDDRCMYLTGKAQMALNKLHALLESRRMREAFNFFSQLLDGTPRMNEILRCIERMHTYQWNYSLARIHFLHNELEKAQHHAEQAFLELERNKDDEIEEPLQSRMWVNMIRAWTHGLTCVVKKNAHDVERVLELWEKTVCDLDRQSVQRTIGLKTASVFGRLKFVEFLMIAVRAFPELEINSYADVSLPENSNVISIGKALLFKLRSITQELLHKADLSVEVTNHRYHPVLDQAMTQLGYLSTSLEGLLNNWVLVIDAGPVGNQGRYANHTDDPNAVLALGEASGIRVRVLRAIKPIHKGDEITVHYGPNYWDTIFQNRKSTICKKYDTAGTSSIAPSLDRAVRSNAPPTKRQRGDKTKPDNTSRSFYAFKSKYEFKFFDGIVSDLNGSGLPALVLLQSLGDMGTSSDAYDMVTSCRKKGLVVVDCPPDHAAYPGKMLVADREFQIGEQICIYAGIMSRMPEAQLKLNESDYISTVCHSSSGPYGFELEDPEAKNGAVFKKYQRQLPTLTPQTSTGKCIPNANPPVDLGGIEDIRGLGPECTKKIIETLIDPTKRELITRLIKRLNNLPDKQWKSHAQNEVRKLLQVRLPAAPPKEKVPESITSEESEEEQDGTESDAKRDTGLNGKFWGPCPPKRIYPNDCVDKENIDGRNIARN